MENLEHSKEYKKILQEEKYITKKKCFQLLQKSEFKYKL